MSNKILDKNDMNSIIQLGINEEGYIVDSDLTNGNVKSLDDEGVDEIVSVERRVKKSERRINDSHDYRGPARRLTIDRRK